MREIFNSNEIVNTKGGRDEPDVSEPQTEHSNKKMVSDASSTIKNNNAKRDNNSGEKTVASGSNLGRRGDPRMHKAVAARVSNPSISLLEALVEGGFQFPEYCEGSGKSDRDIFDTDGVQLCQRKNQLSRRLRLMRKRGEAEASAARSNQSAGANSTHVAGTPGEDGNVFNPYSTDSLLASQTLGVNMSPQLMNLMLLQQQQRQQQAGHQDPDLGQMPGVDSSRLLASAMQQQQQQLRGKRPLDSDSLTDQQSSNGGIAPPQRLVQNLQMNPNNYVGLENTGNAVAMQAAMFASGPVPSNFIPYASFLSQNNFSQPPVGFQVPIQGGDKQPTASVMGGALPNGDLNRFLGMTSAASMGLGGEQQQMQALMKNGFQGLTDSKSSEGEPNNGSFLMPTSTQMNGNDKSSDMEPKQSENSNNAVKLSLAVNLFKAERQDLIEKCLSKVGLNPHDSSIMQDFELKLSSSSDHHLEL